MRYHIYYLLIRDNLYNTDIKHLDCIRNIDMKSIKNISKLKNIVHNQKLKGSEKVVIKNIVKLGD